MPLSRLDLRGVPSAAVAGRLPPAPSAGALPTAEVAAVIEQVRTGGDQALLELTAKFDGVTLEALRVPAEAVQRALESVPVELRRALELAHARITAYHAGEAAPGRDFVSEGVTVTHLVRPVRRAGLYAPGGRARYPSTVLMCAAPARVAGVEELVLCVPPGRDGSVDDASLAAAAIAGVDEVYGVGGAQAIAALAFGTETIRAVDVVVGPGNRYVAEAKRQVSGIVGVPSAFTGPSEVVVVADDHTPCRWAAVDLAVQAEHGPDGLAWLITWSEKALSEIEVALEEMVRRSPRRQDLESTLAGGGLAVLVDGPAEALAVSNAVAPEHLELLVDGADALLPLVERAGAVFVGPLTPASLGDYVAGPNHVLPTARTARFASALGVADFRTTVHAVTVDRPGLARLAPAVAAIAEVEGLPAHAESVRLRVEA
ncbi:MAG TPA: histidinol dehydrogenase [Acidimicrobiaceae bacterium]|nr:histidinol dehydrogenase [Acidimicrobiaceae bacterium]